MASQADPLQERRDLLVARARFGPGDPQWDLDILGGGERVQKSERLEDEGDVLTPDPVEVTLRGIRDDDLSDAGRSARRRLDTAKDVQEGRLSRPRGADEHDEFARVQLQRGPDEGVHLSGGRHVGHRQVGCRDHGLHGTLTHP